MPGPPAHWIPAFAGMTGRGGNDDVFVDCGGHRKYEMGMTMCSWIAGSTQIHHLLQRRYTITPLPSSQRKLGPRVAWGPGVLSRTRPSGHVHHRQAVDSGFTGNTRWE